MKVVAFDSNQATSPGEGLGNGTVVSVKPKSRSGSIIGAISPIMGTGWYSYTNGEGSGSHFPE